MSEPFIGEIRIIAENFAPQGWFFCNGDKVSINQYTPLYAVIGTLYGGDGRTNFALPDLRGCAPICQGQGPGLTNQTIGEFGGTNTVALDISKTPSHTHTVAATNAVGTSNDPTGRIWARYAGLSLYSTTNDNPVPMSTNALGVSGSPDPINHDNVQPCLGINFAIAWEGVFPARP